jgi:hypothetical protein
MKITTIAKWFMRKNFTLGEQQAMANGCEYEVKRETEKAFYLFIATDFGLIKSWVPKSVCNK